MIREARLKRTLFQSIVIYNLVIVIENNGIIVLNGMIMSLSLIV